MDNSKAIASTSVGGGPAAISVVVTTVTTTTSLTSCRTPVTTDATRRRIISPIRLVGMGGLERQDYCCGHWFPSSKSYHRHLAEKAQVDLMHEMKLVELGMVRCTQCSMWVLSDSLSSHLRKVHGIIKISKNSKVNSEGKEITGLNGNTVTKGTNYIIKVSGQSGVKPCNSDTSGSNSVKVAKPSTVKLVTTPSSNIYHKLNNFKKAGNVGTGKVIVHKSVASPVVNIGPRVVMKSLGPHNVIPLANTRKILPHPNATQTLPAGTSIATTTTINGITTVRFSGGKVIKAKNMIEKKTVTGSQENVQNINGQSLKLIKKAASVKINSKLPTGNSQTADNPTKEVTSATKSKDKARPVMSGVCVATKNSNQAKKSRKQVLKPKLPDTNDANSVKEAPVTVRTKKKVKKSPVKGVSPLNASEANASNPSSQSKKGCKKKTKSAQESNVNNSKTSKQTPRGVRGPKKKKKGPGRPRKILVNDSPDLSEVDSLFNEVDQEDTENEPIVLKKKDDDNIPTVELDMFTLPSLNEQVSVLLTEPENPNFKVYASMDAIFVGDSALGDVTNQIGGYVTDANNVIYVNPSHFLFPKVDDLENFVPSPILTMKGNKVSLSAGRQMLKLNTNKITTPVVLKENKFATLGTSKDSSNAANISEKLAHDDKGSRVSSLSPLCLKQKINEKLLKDGSREVNQLDDVLTVKLGRVTKAKSKQNKGAGKDNVSVPPSLSHNGIESLSNCKDPVSLSSLVPSENSEELKSSVPVATESPKVQKLLISVKTKSTKTTPSSKNLVSLPVPKDTSEELISSVPVPARSTKAMPTSSKQTSPVSAEEKRSDTESVTKEKRSDTESVTKEKTLPLTVEEGNSEEQVVSLSVNKEISIVMMPSKKETSVLVDKGRSKIMSPVKEKTSAVPVDEESSSTVSPSEEQTFSTTAGEESSKEEEVLRKTDDESSNIVAPEHSLSFVPDKEGSKEEEEVFGKIGEEGSEKQTGCRKLGEESSSTLLSSEQKQTLVRKIAEDSSNTVPPLEEQTESTAADEKRSEEQIVFRKVGEGSSNTVLPSEDQSQSTAADESSKEQTVFRKVVKESPNKVLPTKQTLSPGALEGSYIEQTVFRKVGEESTNTVSPSEEQTVFTVAGEGRLKEQTTFRKIEEESSAVMSFFQDEIPTVIVDDECFRELIESSPVKEDKCSHAMLPLEEKYQTDLVVDSDTACRKMIHSSPVKEEHSKTVSPLKEQTPPVSLKAETSKAKNTRIHGRQKTSLLGIARKRKGRSSASSEECAAVTPTEGDESMKWGNVDEENQDSGDNLEGLEGRTAVQVENKPASSLNSVQNLKVSSAIREVAQEEKVLKSISPSKLHTGSGSDPDLPLCSSPLVVTHEIITKGFVSPLIHVSTPVLFPDNCAREDISKNEMAGSDCADTLPVPSPKDSKFSLRGLINTPRKRSRTKSADTLCTAADAESRLADQLSRSTGDIDKGAEYDSNNSLKLPPRRHIRQLGGESSLVLEETLLNIEEKSPVCDNLEERLRMEHVSPRLKKRWEEESTALKPDCDSVSHKNSCTTSPKKLKSPLFSMDSGTPGKKNKITVETAKRKAETCALQDGAVRKIPEMRKRLRKRRHTTNEPPDSELKVDGLCKLESEVTSLDMKEKCIRERLMGNGEPSGVRSVRERTPSVKCLENIAVSNRSPKKSSSIFHAEQQPGYVNLVTRPPVKKRHSVSKTPENNTGSETLVNGDEIQNRTMRVSSLHKDKKSSKAEVLLVSPLTENELSPPREWHGRGAKLKAQVLIQDQQAGVIDSHVFPSRTDALPHSKDASCDIVGSSSPKPIPLSPNFKTQIIPSNQQPKTPDISSLHTPSKPLPSSTSPSVLAKTTSPTRSITSYKSPKTPSSPDREWQARGAKLKAQVSIRDQQATFVGYPKLTASPVSSCLSSPPAKKIKLEASPVPMKDIRSFFVQKSPPPIKTEDGHQSCSRKVSFTPPATHTSRKRMKRFSESKEDIRSFFIPEGSVSRRKSLTYVEVHNGINSTGDSVHHSPGNSPKMQESVEVRNLHMHKTCEPVERKVLFRSAESLPNVAFDFEGFVKSSRQSSRHMNSLVRLVSLLSIKKWYNVGRFPFPVDQLCDWDEELLYSNL